MIWENRPDVPLKKIVCLDLNECGELSSLKIERVREKLKKFKCDSIILTLLDDIACKIYMYLKKSVIANIL